MVYLPFAGFLGALLAWLILEPMMTDMSVIGGEVVLVQTDPLEFSDQWEFDRSAGEIIKVTVGEREALLMTGLTRREPGADGQPPFRAWDDIVPGEMIEVAGEVPEDGFGHTLIDETVMKVNARFESDDSTLLSSVSVIYIAFCIFKVLCVIMQLCIKMPSRCCIFLYWEKKQCAKIQFILF